MIPKFKWNVLHQILTLKATFANVLCSLICMVPVTILVLPPGCCVGDIFSLAP